MVSGGRMPIPAERSRSFLARQVGTLADVLMADKTVTARFDRAAVEKMTDPANYLGAAPAMVDKVLGSVKR